MIEKLLLKNILPKIPGVVRHVGTFIIVMFGWLLFAATDGIPFIMGYLGAMFTGPVVMPTVIYDLVRCLPILAILFVGSTPLPLKLYKRMQESGRGRIAVAIGAGLVLVLATAYMVASSYSPFLYFRF